MVKLVLKLYENMVAKMSSHLMTKNSLQLVILQKGEQAVKFKPDDGERVVLLASHQVAVVLDEKIPVPMLVPPNNGVLNVAYVAGLAMMKTASDPFGRLGYRDAVQDVASQIDPKLAVTLDGYFLNECQSGRSGAPKEPV